MDRFLVAILFAFFTIQIGACPFEEISRDENPSPQSSRPNWKDPTQRLQFLKSLERELHIKQPSDWLKVELKSLKPLGAFNLVVSYYRSSVLEVARSLYPETTFQFWKMKRIPKGEFSSFERQREFLLWLAKEKGITKPEDWYRLSTKDVMEKGGTELLKIYGYSKARLLEEHFPSVRFYDWLFAGKLSNNFWDLPENRKQYMLWLQSRLGIKQPEDWYRVDTDAIKRNYGAGILIRFGGHKLRLLQDFMPEADLKPWLFESGPPKGFFKSKQNQYLFLQWLRNAKGFDTGRIKRLTAEDLRKFGANSLLSLHGRSPRKVATALLALEGRRHEPWLGNAVPTGYWADPQNRRAYLAWLADRKGWTKPEDWYGLSHEVLKQEFGQGISNHYSKLADMAREMHPDHEFHEWLFGRVPPGFWAQRKNQRAYLRWLEKRLAIEAPEDWYRVSIDTVAQHSGSGLLDIYNNSVSGMVIKNFPEYSLNPESFLYYSKGEEALFNQVQKMFPGEKVYRRYKLPGIKFQSGRPVEVDVYVPGRSLALEYQGIQHYQPVAHFGGETGFKDVQRRDAEKRTLLEGASITEIEVHHSWDQTAPTLRNYFKAHPELLN